MVPQKKSAHLTDLLNEVSSPEYIKDYGCVRCRVNHVLETATATGQGRELAAALAPYADQRRLAELPDELEAQLPRSITSPISKSMQFGRLPAILAIHLSRSIYGGYGASRNSCKVTVVETIELWENIDELESAGRASSDEKKKTSIEMAAQLLGNRHKVTYRLVAMIRHKGTHHAGHYECFRRKNLEWWIDHLPKSKPESPASSASTANNSASNSPRNSESGTSNGSADRTKASENAVSKVVPESVPSSPGLADVNQSFQSKRMTANSASTASSAPAVVVTLDNGTLPAPKKLKDEGAKPVALAGRVSLSKEEDDDDENHSKLPFPQANRTTPLATSKIDVTTPKQQLAYSSSSSSVVSLVAQAQQAQQHQQQQQQQQPKQQQLHQHQHKQHNSQSQYQTPQGTAVSRHFGIDVAPPSQYEWWKISDEKTWECSTRDVLKEESGAYLLFYERV